MKLTRRKLRRLILKEAKLIQEGSVSDLIIEMAEILEQHMIATGRNQMSLRTAIRLLALSHPTAAEFPPNELEEFVRDMLIEGQMDFAGLEYEIHTTAMGREIELVIREGEEEQLPEQPEEPITGYYNKYANIDDPDEFDVI